MDFYFSYVACIRTNPIFATCCSIIQALRIGDDIDKMVDEWNSEPKELETGRAKTQI
jgi:hypothetical protein